MTSIGPLNQRKNVRGLDPLDGARSRVDLAVDALVRAILSGRFASGERLVERDIAVQLGISKTPAREALKIIEQRGLVTTSLYRGAEVTVVDDALARNVSELRILTEPRAVSLAVPYHTADTIAAIRAALDQSARAAAVQDLVELTIANREFHRRLYVTCPNILLREVLDRLQDRVALISVTSWRRRATWRPELAEHHAILAAIVEGDPIRAEREVKTHLDRFSVGMLSNASGDPVPGGAGMSIEG